MTATSEIRARLERLTGSTLTTLQRHRKFDVVDVSLQWVVVKPSAGKGGRQIKRERIEEIAALRVPQDRILRTIHDNYPHKSEFNSSYMAAIVAEITT
jgi:hypothetical protein